MHTADGQLVGYSERYAGDQPAGRSAWLFDPALGSIRIGKVDSEHTGTGGIQHSAPKGINNAGRAIGVSYRYDGDSFLGQSAWAYDAAGGTVLMGLVDSEHTRADGYRYSESLASAFYQEINSLGQVIGISLRHSGLSGAGSSAWFFNPVGGTSRIGFTDSEHTRANGHQESFASFLNDAGQVVGLSRRYLGTLEVGSSAWLFHPTSGMTRIGLIDAEHTSTTGGQEIAPLELNDGGQSIGHSARFAGSARVGLSAWIHDASSGVTTRIGLTDGLHTRADGYQRSAVFPIQFMQQMLNAPGHVIGTSNRYSGMSDAGFGAWVYDPSAGVSQIGFVDAVHTGSDGSQISAPFGLNDSGQVIGISRPYNGALVTGFDAWIYNAISGTTRIGLTDAEHTRSDGRQDSRPFLINEAGAVVGQAARYTASGKAGFSTWFYDSSGLTQRIGISNPQHTSATGFRFSGPIALNHAGQTIGTSNRYSGAAAAGQSGWFFDPVLAVTHPLIFSVRDDGYAFTDPDLLAESGWVLGTYEQFSGSMSEGTRAFLWSLANGFADLGSLVDGGIGAHGWSALSSVVGANEFQTIFGLGGLIGAPGQGVYVLTIPAPASIGLLLLALPLPLRRRRA